MSFFNRMFGAKITENTTTDESKVIGFKTALSMHIRGEAASALSAYNKISGQNPEDNLAPFFTAAIHAEKGETVEAAEILRDLSRRISEKGENISKAVSLELIALAEEELTGITLPPVASVIVAFGDILKADGFVQESAVCFEIAVGLVPDRADVIHKFGDTLHDLHFYDYAESVLLEALKLAPFHWGSLYTYAVLLQDLGRDIEAINYYERAVRIDPNHSKCRNNYGAALMRADRLEEALDQCRMAAELDHDSPFVKINLGNIYLLMQENEKARLCFTEACSLDENNAEAFYGLASVERLLQGDTGKIRELFHKALELNPSVPEFHHALANFLAGNGSPEALEHFTAAAHLNSALKGLQKDFGVACLQFGRREEALEHLKLGLEQSPDDTAILELLAGKG